MKKKLFFKLFIFAVIGAFVTVTSCKDYDEDISGLETEINSVKSELSTLDADISSAQTAAENALAKANDALAAAQAADDTEAIAALETEIAGIQAQLTELSGLEDEVTALMAELTAANAAQLATIEAEVQALSDQLLAMLGGMVTDVELLYSATTQEENLLDLTIAAILEKDNVFEEGISNAITFNEGTKLQEPASIVIRVSPTNAEITPEMINLQTSKGDIYENLEIISVEPYENLLTRSTNGAGLWEVKVQLKDYDEAEFKAATEADGKKILFAVAVDNTQTAENPMIRKVVSTYDLTLAWDEEFTGEAALYFSVDEKPVGEINNRYDNSSISLSNPGTGTLYAEEKWLGAAAVAKTTDPANTTTDTGDDRTAFAAYPAVLGHPLKIALNDPENKIRAMYVTLDFEKNAIDSDPSEWDAWNSYSYTGLGTVVEGTETQITINQAIPDFIGFRVYAVNYDGTLVDPDGKAFYVSLGEETINWSAVNTTVTATQEIPNNVLTTKSATANATLTILTGATSFTWTTDKADDAATTTPAFNAFFTDANNSVLFGTDGSGAVTADFSKVTKVYTQALVADWLAYKDNKVYNGNLTIKDATGHVLATLDVTFKKVLPTAPEGFSVKTNQIADDGIYYSYLEPDVWTAPLANNGTMSLGEVFNFGTGTLTNYETTFAASAGTTAPFTDVVVIGDNTLSVAKSFVDNTIQHATKVVYNFGKISTETKDSGGTVIDYEVTVKEFPTIYSNIYNHTYSWRWATLADLGLAADATLPYSTSIEYGASQSFDLAYIYGVSTRDSQYNAFLNNPYLSSLQVISAKLVSNANNLDEYFTVTPDPLAGATVFTLTQKSGSTNPTADVPSTLVLTAKDMYNNDVTIRLPMTVTKR